MLIGGPSVQSEKLHQVIVLAYDLSALLGSHRGSRVTLTMGVTANCKLDVVRYGHLDHGGFIIDNLLGGNYNLVDVFPVYFLAILKALNHVIDELLCHLILNLYSVVIRFDGDRIDIEAFGGRWFITNIDGGVEVQLAHDLLALGMLKFGIFIAWVELDAFLEVLNCVLGFQDSGIGDCAAEVGLRERDWLEPAEIRYLLGSLIVP